MGGGIMYRSVARLVGAAAAVGSVAAPSSKEAYCHVLQPPVISSSIQQQELLSSSSSFVNLQKQQQQTDACKDPQSNLIDLQSTGDHEWEFESIHNSEEGYASGLRASSGALHRLAFSPPPTEEEVDEATKELHAVLHLALPPLRFDSSSESVTNFEYNKDLPLEALDKDFENNKGLPLEALDKEVMASSSMLSRHPENLTSGNSSVMQALQLLQTNPEVQDAVKSLACDPALWKAVLNNKKVQQLTQSPPVMEVSPDDEKSEVKNEGNSFVKFTSRVCGIVKGKVLKLFDSVVGVLNSMFESVDKTFQGKGSSKLDKTVVSCMMLAVAVMVIVAFKRVVHIARK